MPAPAHNRLRIAVLTGSGKTIVIPLVEAGFQVVGVSEERDQFYRKSRLIRWLEILYWKWIKRRPAPYLPLYAREQGIAYFEKTPSSNESYISWLKQLQPDVLVLHQAPILGADIYTIPRLGTINIHPSMLPKYRGSNPYFWLYYDQDYTAGITLHCVDESIDTGDILAQSSFTFESGTHYSVLARRLLREHALPMLCDLLNRLEKGEPVQRQRQPAQSPTPYARRLSTQEYLQHLDFANSSLQQLWHLLNANEQWREAFLSRQKHANWYQWSLVGPVVRTTQPPYGEVGQDQGGYYINHRQGVVYLGSRFRLLNFVKNLVKKSS